MTRTYPTLNKSTFDNSLLKKIKTNIENKYDNIGENIDKKQQIKSKDEIR